MTAMLLVGQFIRQQLLKGVHFQCGMSSGRYNLYSQGSTGWSTLRNDEFQEDDVWSAFRGSKEPNSISDASRESSTILRRLPTAARMIPKANSNSFPEPKIVPHSAPVNIPDWSKIYGSSSKKASKPASWLDEDHHHGGSDGMMNNSWDSDEEEDEDDGSMIPPHEWIARKLARSQICSSSVYEGVGRTLRGRDLSNVRNAVLTKTGFIE